MVKQILYVIAYCMWLQPHNLLLKRLTVYLSAILKTLFENKVFDTILSHLYQCFCKLLSGFMNWFLLWFCLLEYVQLQTQSQPWPFSSGFESDLHGWSLSGCMLSWVSSRCSSFPAQSKDIPVRWVYVIVCLGLLALWKTEHNVPCLSLNASWVRLKPGWMDWQTYWNTGSLNQVSIQYGRVAWFWIKRQTSL